MRVFIENEAGSRRKNTYDETTHALLRTEDVSAAYPFAYGFVSGTKAGDGDAADCFVLTARKLASGSMIDCEPVALLEQVEDGEVDHKILATIAGESFPLAEAEAAIRQFANAVFSHVPGKRMAVGKLLDRPAAEAYLRSCKTR